MGDMLITQTAEYALRAMAEIAAAPGPLRASEVAAATSIPTHYVSKVLRRMVSAGLLTSQKGHGGGFRLARSPRSIRFEDVIAAADGPADPDRCAFGWPACNDRAPCPLHPAFSQLKSSFRQWVSRTTLQDVSGDVPILRRRSR